MVMSEPALQVLKPTPLWSLAKRSIDVIGGATLLVALSPLLVDIAATVKLSDGGSIFFSDTRIGRNGETFRCHKFRTMVPNAKAVLAHVLASDPARRAEWTRDEKLRDDPRITAIGRLLRKTSLDELPQLWNVIRGEMSLVGPRPASEEGLRHYGRAARWYKSVRPGMTGLWQVSGRNSVSFRRRVVLDIYYVRAQGLLLDLQILFRTVRVVVSCDGH